ncbi:MAG: NmrA/HSCARG family protein [Methanobacteriota archaeon]|nr:MAG: NmrA/HSCARG family protein [Euryarchaeota archaeon]
MAETKTILVAGATGQQGGTVARSLLKRGHRVIGLSRSASKLKGLAAAGIEGVQGDLTQRTSLTPLVRNVDGFFVVTTPFEPDFSVHPEKEVLQGTTAIDAAKAASMRHVVLSSVASADRNTGIPHFESKAKVEQYMRASRVPHTIVRPVAFMDNYVSPWMTSSFQRGIMEVPLPPKTRQQLVAVKDVGEFVARAFDDPNSAIGKTVELAGDDLAFGDLPAALSKKLGHPIRYVEQPEEEARKRMGDDGFRMFQFFKTVGYHVDIPALEAAWGYRMTRFHEFLDAVDWQRLGSGQRPTAP